MIITNEAAEGLANRFNDKMIFENQVNRNMVFKILKSRGQHVRKSSIRNQLLDSHYVADTFMPDLGLRNTKRMFPALYKIETDRWY